MEGGLQLKGVIILATFKSLWKILGNIRLGITNRIISQTLTLRLKHNKIQT